MPTPIRATENMIKETREELLEKVEKFLEELKTKNLTKGNISFNQSYSYSDTGFERPVIEFSPAAWAKMTALISATDTEIAWNGMVDRKDDLHYYISDILVYPQKVTGVTVDPDEGERSLWLSKIPREERCRLGFQGHSHVNMSPSPSGTDMGSRTEIIQHLDANDFYIFMIMNKSYEYTLALYDMKTNALYDTKDVDVLIDVGGIDLLQWVKTEKQEKIKRTTYATNYSTSYNYKKEKSKDKELSSYIEKGKKSEKEKKEKPKSISKSQLKISSTSIVSNLLIGYDEANKIMNELLGEVNAGLLDNEPEALLTEAEILMAEHDALDYEDNYSYYGGLYDGWDYR